MLHEHVSASIMVFKFESRAEATALLRRRSRDAAVALLNKEFTAQRWTLRKELKLSVRPLVTLRYFRRAVGAVRAPAPGARELCAGGAGLAVALRIAGLSQLSRPATEFVAIEMGVSAIGHVGEGAIVEVH